MLFGIEFSPELHQQLVNVLLLQVAVDSRGSHTCTLAWLQQHRSLCLGCKHYVVERNPLHNAAAAPAAAAPRSLARPK